MKVLDLFSGIGGFSLAAEQLGWETIAFVEKDTECHKVLNKHFPTVPIFDDVTTFDGRELTHTIDIICGGFPCQDISAAGKRVGITGKRSGLWSELHRLIREIRPKYAVVENVSALLGRGMDVVLGDLSEIGYDAEWRVFSACELGFPHPRERVFIVAYPNGKPRSFSVLDRYCSEVAQRYQNAEEWRKNRFVSEMVSSPTRLLRDWEAKFSQSPLVRMDDGIPNILHRLRMTGNSIVPQIALEIFRAIQDADMT